MSEEISPELVEVIRQAKAEAWDEGHYMSELSLQHAYDGHDCAEGEMCPTCCQPNPYRAYGDEFVKVARKDSYQSAMLLTDPENRAAVEAAARALNAAGWTCAGGEHEPGHYDDCNLCRDLCDDMARTALRAAREVRSHE